MKEHQLIVSDKEVV